VINVELPPAGVTRLAVDAVGLVNTSATSWKHHTVNDPHRRTDHRLQRYRRGARALLAKGLALDLTRGKPSSAQLRPVRADAGAAGDGDFPRGDGTELP